MSLLVQKLVLTELDKVHRVPELELRVERGKAPYEAKVHPYSSDEPLSRRYRGRAAVRYSGQVIESAAQLVVTRRRLILMLESGINTRGLNSRVGEVALVSVDRADLGPPQLTSTFTGKVKRAEFAGKVYPFAIQLYMGNLEKFLEAMRPKNAEQLGSDAAAEFDKKKRMADAKAAEDARIAEAERKRVQAERFGESDRQASPRGATLMGVPTGILDHLKTWRYKMAAPAEQCVNGFIDAFSGSGGLIMKARWSVERTPKGAVAVYQGRKGLVAVATAFSQTAQSEEAAAVGSEVRFEVEEQGDRYTICAMWLATRATRLGFTSDGRFFRPYMRAVEMHLRQVDPSLQVVKE